MVWYGEAPGAALPGRGGRPSRREGTTFTLVARGQRWRAAAVAGRHFAHRPAVVAAAEHFDVPLDEAVARLATLPPVPGRLNPLAGRRGSLILDDSYNASPAAVLAGLDVLAGLETPSARRRAGGHGRAGRRPSEALHREVGRRAAGVVDVLVTRGKRGGLDRRRGAGGGDWTGGRST